MNTWGSERPWYYVDSVLGIRAQAVDFLCLCEAKAASVVMRRELGSAQLTFFPTPMMNEKT